MYVMEPVLFAIVTVTILTLYRKWNFWKAVEKMPGPLALPLVGTAYIALMTARKDRLRVFDEVTKKYWPIYRSWMGSLATINISKPEHLEKVLGSSEFINKAAQYHFLTPWLGEGLLTSAGAKWFSHRKMLTPAFHFKILDNFIELYGEKAQILVKTLEKKAGGQAFDIYPYITRCALDIICETAMGTSVDAQNETESDYVSAVYKISNLTVKRIVSPWLHIEFIFQRTAAGREFYKQLDILHSFTKKVIKQRQTLRKCKESNATMTQVDDIGMKQRLAFLDLLLDASEHGQKLSDKEIQEEVDTFMFEGHDTTSAALCWSLVRLGHHHDIQDQVFSEQTEIFGDDRVRLPTLQDLNNMKYLEMVIKETLRHYPSVPFIGRKATKDVEIGDYTIPEGSTLNLHIYHAHRDPDHWPHPDRFDPDNFLPERMHGRHPYAYVPFSAGPRNCIGQRFAALEMKAVLSLFLRNYRVETMEKPEDIKVAIELIMKPLNEVMMRLTPR